MRLFLMISLVFATFSLAATAQNGLVQEPFVQLPAPQQKGDLLGFSNATAEGGQLITLIDASQKVMSVYHVDSQSGQITLRSVRRLAFDFAIEEFNANPPLPADIRQMLGRRPPN